MMANRPLILFKPIKNSFTKSGDKKLLAKALDIPVGRIEDYITSVTEDIKQIENMNYLPKDKMDKIKTYIYRHGSKDQVVTFLDYELSRSKNVLKTLYSTFTYNSGGIADYFVRPIHRMDNKAIVNIYHVIDKHIKINKQNGNLDENDALKIANWSLEKIYTIQNNQKFLNLLKMQKTLS